MQAGYRDRSAVTIFYGIKVAVIIAVFLVLLVTEPPFVPLEYHVISDVRHVRVPGLSFQISFSRPG